MSFCAVKNAYSTNGADVAPYSRSAVNSDTSVNLSDTAIAVSVLFMLIMNMAVIIGSGTMISVLCALMIMCITQKYIPQLSSEKPAGIV